MPFVPQKNYGDHIPPRSSPNTPHSLRQKLTDSILQFSCSSSELKILFCGVRQIVGMHIAQPGVLSTVLLFRLVMQISF